MKNNYKTLIIDFLNQIDDEKHLRYLYILMKKMSQCK